MWFTAAEARANRALRAVDLDGKERLVAESPGSLTLWDAAPDGRVLLTRDDERRSLIGVPPGETTERDLSAFDDAGLAALSADGRLLLFGDRFGVYLRPTDGSPPVKLGFKDVFADDLSPDGRLVLATSASTNQLIVLPTGAGEAQPLPAHGITSYHGAKWFPDGDRILFNAWVTEQVSSSPSEQRHPAPFVRHGSRRDAAATVDSGGRLRAGRSHRTAPAWRSSARGRESPSPGGWRRREPVRRVGAGRPAAWRGPRTAARSGCSGAARSPPASTASRSRPGAARNGRGSCRPIPPGVFSIADLRITPRGDSYFYSYRRILSELYVAVGMR